MKLMLAGSGPVLADVKGVCRMLVEIRGVILCAANGVCQQEPELAAHAAVQCDLSGVVYICERKPVIEQPKSSPDD